MSMGGSPPPQPAPVPVAPLVDPVQVAAQNTAAEQAYLQQNARGRASTILTSPLGANEDPSNVASKTLGGGGSGLGSVIFKGFPPDGFHLN